MNVPRSIAIAGFAVALVACDHTSPFTSGDYASTGPLSPTPPLRLTYDSGVDTRAVWLPDGSSILYTQEQLDRTDRDRCLAVLLASGGAVSRTICPGGDLHGDSLDDFESPALLPSGRMAYVRTSMVSAFRAVGPDHAELVLATFAAPLDATILSTLPYFGPASRPVDIVSDLHWTGPSTLVFLAEQQSFPAPCGNCTPDTVRTGLDVERIDLGQTPPLITLVPNTDQATSVAVGGPDTIYYSLAGDSRAHRRLLSTGADTVVMDFGAPVTDLTVAGSRMAGVAAFAVRVVDLNGGGLDTTFSALPSHMHRPALSLDTHRLVVEVSAVDTLTLRESPPDLWLWRLP